MSLPNLKGCIVLPPKEFYSPEEAGGVALAVRSSILPNEYVIGRQPHRKPYTDTAFIAVRSLSHKFLRRLSYVWSVIKILRNEKPDYIEVHNKPNIALVLRHAFPNIPIILVLHNDPCSMKKAKTPRQRRALAARMHIVAKSSWIKSRFLKGMASRQVTVIPNAINLTEIPPISDKKPLILFVGRITKDKGADSFIDACNAVLSNFPKWEAMMIGGDRFDARTQSVTPFMQTIFPILEKSPIAYQGLKPHSFVLDMMAKAAITVVPSRMVEPFGRTALEAMACGCALITTKRGALPAVVQDNGLYIDPDDPSELSTKIETLIKNKPLRDKLTVGGLRRARDFSSPIIRQMRRDDISHLCRQA